MVKRYWLLHVQNLWMFQIIKWTRCHQLDLLIVNRRRNAELSSLKAALLVYGNVKAWMCPQGIDQRLIVTWIFNSVADQQPLAVQLVADRQDKGKWVSRPRLFIVTQLKNCLGAFLFNNLEFTITRKTMLRLVINLALIFVLIVF